MYCYLYVESKTNKGFQFIPCESELFYNNLKTKIDKLKLFNTSKIELCQ
jgi:hypothetical protein